MAPVRPQVESFAGGLVVTLSGELDAYDAPALRTAFSDAATAAGGTTVVLDLAAVTFLDSTALGAVVGLLRRVRESGGRLRVVLPETEARRIFELTALDRSLDVWPSRESALDGAPAPS
jgi:anti-sigma B factor antagonist